jgi:integrase
MKRANRPWDDEERETVLLAAPVHLRAMIGLAMFAGLREGDACAMPKMGYDGKRIETIASKNREPIWIPAHYRLRQILEAAAAVRKERLQRRARRYKVLQIDPPVLAVTTRGTAWTESGFRAVFFGLIGELEMAGKVRPGLTFHGLRHTLGKLVIEAGGSKEDVAMILGDRSLAMGEFYSREHSKVGRMTATVHRLEQTEREKLENSGSDSGKPETGQKTGSK